MAFLRAVLCNVLLFLSTLLVPGLLLPFCKIPAMQRVCQKNYGRVVRFVMRLTLNAKTEFRGLDKLPKDKPVILISKHQSVYETIMLPSVLDRPAFVMKKELLKIPIIGTWMKASGQIAIDRSAGRKALKQINVEAKEILGENRIVVIFPEGTRSTIGTHEPYTVGAYALAKEFPDVPVFPVALNTGTVWRKDQFIKGTGTIIIEIMDEMDKVSNYKSREYLKLLENTIEPKTRELEQENNFIPTEPETNQ